jgi:hypothetical protein
MTPCAETNLLTRVYLRQKDIEEAVLLLESVENQSSRLPLT